MPDPILCTECKTPLRAGARFCPTCGTTIDPALWADGQKDQPPVPAENNHDEPISPGSTNSSAQHKQEETRPRVIIRDGAEETVYLLEQTDLIIGRDPAADLPIGLPTATNHVGLPDVSRRHARISATADGFTLEDLDSRNGTYLRGKPIPPHTPFQLQNEDVIRIGDIYGNSISLTFRSGAKEAETISDVSSIDLAKIYDLPVASIGRNPQSDIPLPSSVVSWSHAQFVRTAAGHDLVDLGSTNGTFVNGQRIQKASLKQGDVIQIGPYRMEYGLTAVVSASQTLRIDGINLQRTVKTQAGPKTILDDISLTILPKEFVALVGGSGAGKSTLMDALNGSRPATAGQVLINGEDLYRHYDAYRGDMGYVPQADILHTTLSVQKALSYTAQLRLPPDTSKQEIQKRIDDVLEMVEMTEQKNVQISRLSGGQRKRVSIASEMISEPRLLFLDEPTSGLDPGLDKKMMRTLNNLADSGRTIMLTTHATSNILDMCDHVVFLSFGKLVYFGPPQKAMNFYQTPDFSTIYAKVDTREETKEAEAKYKQSEDYHEYVLSRQESKPAADTHPPATRLRKKSGGIKAGLRQFGILTHRYFDLILNDRMSLFILGGAMPLIGILLLLIANPKSLVGHTEAQIWHMARSSGSYSIAPDTQKLLFMLALAAILLGLFASAYEIIKERVVYERERMINLQISSYVLSKVVLLMAFGLIQCLLLLVVVSLRVTYPTRGVLMAAFPEMYITLVLAMFASVGIGLFISAMARSNNSVIYIILVVLFVQILFSGAIFNLPQVAKFISYLTPTRWAFEALGSSVNINRLNNLGQVYFEEIDEMVTTRIDFNVNFASNPEHLWLTWLILALFGVVSIAAAIFYLKAQDRRKI